MRPFHSTPKVGPSWAYSLLVPLLLSAALAFTGHAQDTAAPSVKAAPPIAAALQPFVDSHEMAGAVTLVATKDKVLSVDAVGYADLGAKTPMTKDTLFWIASMSKPMTATAFMMLVDEGTVNLDDPVEKYLPEFKGQMYIAEKDATHILLKKPTHPITLHNLLSHTSGLPPISPIETPTLDLLPLELAVRSHAMSALRYDPSTSYEYSNAGINTAGRVIEVVTGMPYEKFLQERLLDPLGMTDTVWIPSQEQVERLAKSYKAGKSGLEEIHISQLHYPLTDPERKSMPAGGLFSTAADIAKFGQMILNGGVYNGKRFLSEAAIAEMTRKQTGDVNKAPYGYGWGIEGCTFGHGGAYKTNLNINPQLGLVTVFMVQQGSDWPTKEGDKILPTFHDAANRLILNSPEYVAKPILSPEGTPEMEDNFTYAAADIEGHAPTTGAGVWNAPTKANLGISTTGGKAVIRAGEDQAVASYPIVCKPDTLYTLTAVLDFAGPRAIDCWAGVGFASAPDGGNGPNSDNPWMLIRPQAAQISDGMAVGLHGTAGDVGDWTAYAAFYPTITAQITVNTQTNVAKYYVNGNLEGTATLKSPEINCIFFKGYRTGDIVSVRKVSLYAEPAPATVLAPAASS